MLAKITTKFNPETSRLSTVMVGVVVRGVSATLQVCHTRVILGGAACRLGEPGEVDDVLGVLGVDRVVPIVVRVFWCRGTRESE